MGVSYQAVTWNPFKKKYDLLLVGSVALYLVLFLGGTLLFYPKATLEITLMRAFGSAAFILLHVVLCSGPLARLHKKFLPFVYNRRHMGVTVFILSLFHVVLVIATYHAGGDLNPFLSIFLSDFGSSISHFPFQAFGFVAFIILFLMVATSHDFWLANLTAPVWKTLHMLIYIAYAALVIHVVFGVLQAETHPFYTISVFGGFAVVLFLHVLVAVRGVSLDKDLNHLASDGFVEIGHVDDIKEKRAKIVSLSGERVAVFKYEGKISAISNVCQHQNGPLGEGKFVDGCITCPWHGYQYLPESGESPPPFTEKIPTFTVKVKNGKILVDPNPHPPGTYVKPASVTD